MMTENKISREIEHFWPALLEAIEKRVSPKNFHTWFNPLKFIECHNDNIYVGVRDRFTCDWIKDHGYKDIIQQEFSALLSRDVHVMLRILDKSVSYSSELKDRETFVEKKFYQEKQSTVRTYIDAARETGLNPRYTFDQFVVGTSNQLAYAASINVVENPAGTYNPLFIYGGAGLGKTHLLNAIGHSILSDRPNFRVLYISTETFVNEMINSIRTSHMDSFRDKYRSNCDLLLIDDIQFLSAKVRTQEEFFHTFDTLYESHRQIVLTSDSYPKDIPELEERLRTRFQWGLIADIQPPEIETRIAILQKKADNEGLDIPDDVGIFVASTIKSNVREIEGALKRLGALSSMYGKSITLEFAKDVLKDVINSSSPLSVGDIQKAVCSFYNIRISDMKGKRRHRSITRPRQIAMYICRCHLNASFPDIGNQFNKDHSTVMSAVRGVEKLIKTDSSVCGAIEEITRQLGL